MDKAVLDFLSKGGKIIQCKPRAPRRNEKTWTANKYSIYNIGAQGVSMGKQGVKATRDYV